MSSNTEQYGRAIKLIASKLEKTKDRIQEKFLEVDEKLNYIDNALNGLQMKLDAENQSSIGQGDLDKLTDRITMLENTISSLQSEITQVKKLKSETVVSQPKRTIPAPQTRTDTSSIPSEKQTIPKPEKQDIPAPSPKRSIPSPGAIPAPGPQKGIPSPSIPKPGKSPAIPAPKADMGKSIPKVIPSPSAIPKTSANKKTNIPSPRNRGEKEGEDKDNLLEALKSIDSLNLDSEE